MGGRRAGARLMRWEGYIAVEEVSGKDEHAQ